MGWVVAGLYIEFTSCLAQSPNRTTASSQCVSRLVTGQKTSFYSEHDRPREQASQESEHSVSKVVG